MQSQAGEDEEELAVLNRLENFGMVTPVPPPSEGEGEGQRPSKRKAGDIGVRHTHMTQDQWILGPEADKEEDEVNPIEEDEEGRTGED